jgi:predicted cobalt transporter CbtA
VVEYALVLVHSSMAGLGLLTQQVNAWVGDINWTLAGYAALCLVAFRIALWAFKTPQ